MRFLILLLSFVSSSILAAHDYSPATIFPKESKAKEVGYIKPNYIFECNQNQKLVLRRNYAGNVTYGSCYTCPTDFPEWDNVIVDTTPDPDRWICQKPCGANEKRLPRFQGAGFSCYTCTEIYKEWQGDQCVTKSCPAPLVLDTNDGKCKEYDVKCSPYQEKVYSYSDSRPYCTSFCQSGQYRNKQGFCKTIPSCQANQQLTFTQEMVKTTSYKEYKCQTLCLPDQNEIDGKCFARCELNEVFEDGQCVSQDGIIRAINRLKNRFTDITYNNIDDLHDLSDSAIEDLETANQDLENFEPNPPQNNDYDLTQLEADTPFFNIDTILDDSLFASRNQCPSDRSFQIWSTSYDFKFSRICGFLQLLSYLVMCISIVLSYFIIRGR